MLHFNVECRDLIKGKIELLGIMCGASEKEKIKDIESLIQFGFPEHAKKKHNVDEAVRFARFLDEQTDDSLLGSSDPNLKNFWKLCKKLFEAVKKHLDI